jgi:hypothetical protein
VRKLIAPAAGMLAVGLLLVGCTSSPGTSQQQETNRQQSSYDRLVAAEPAREMTNPISRRNINRWIETWDDPSALAYVYLLGVNGQLIGYYVLDSTPSNMCDSLTPNYRIEEHRGTTLTRHVVPAPSLDGVYRSGNECQRYYGFDAVSGAYIEFTIGSHFLSNQPLPLDVQPLGVATIENVASR